MLESHLKNNQFISDIVEDFPAPGYNLSIVQQLEPFNALGVNMEVAPDAIIRCNKNILLCNLIRLMLNSVFFLDYDELISNNTTSTALNFECPMFNTSHNVVVTAELPSPSESPSPSGNFNLEIIYNYYDGLVSNPPYLTIFSKIVSEKDIVEPSVVTSYLDITPDKTIQTEILSIDYRDSDRSAFEIDKNKCDIRVIRTLDRFIDNKICTEIPASLTISFADFDTSICESNSEEAKDALKQFFSMSHFVTTTTYGINEYGIQNSIIAESSLVINKYLFKMQLSYSDDTINFSVDMINDNQMILSLVFESTLEDIMDVFNGTTLREPTVSGDCSEIENIGVDIFLEGYTGPASQFAKFDYVIVDTSNNNVYIIQNINTRGSKTSLHTRNDGGLNPIDDYININGDILIVCAVPLLITYDHWNSSTYGKFSTGSIQSLLSYNWTNSGYTFSGVYNADENNIQINPGCIF